MSSLAFQIITFCFTHDYIQEWQEGGWDGCQVALEVPWGVWEVGSRCVPRGLTFWRSVCSCFSITSSWYTLPVRSRGGSSLERQGTMSALWHLKCAFAPRTGHVGDFWEPLLCIHGIQKVHPMAPTEHLQSRHCSRHRKQEGGQTDKGPTKVRTNNSARNEDSPLPPLLCAKPWPPSNLCGQSKSLSRPCPVRAPHVEQRRKPGRGQGCRPPTLLLCAGAGI